MGHTHNNYKPFFRYVVRKVAQKRKRKVMYCSDHLVVYFMCSNVISLNFTTTKCNKIIVKTVVGVI